MDLDIEKIESILSVIQLKRSLKDEEYIEEEHLREAVGGSISSELYSLRETGVIELTEHSDQNYIRLTEDACTELEGEKPFNLDLNPDYLEESEESEDVPEMLEDDNLLDKGMEIKHPEKYVAALKPFGDAVEHNPEIALSEAHIENYVGENLDFQLRTLAEWDYLEEIGPDELGITRTDSSFYRLNIDDRDVRADAVFSARHIREYYGGSVEQFLNEYSEQDSNALSKKGVKFYKPVG